MTQTVTEARTVPTPLQVPSEDLKELMKRVKKIIPKFIIGKQAEVDPHAVEVRDYANYAIAYWEQQLAVANLRIQQQMGDAEIATVNGIPVVKRYQGVVEAEKVPRPAGWRDYLKGVKH
jgi:hypothetical protein